MKRRLAVALVVSVVGAAVLSCNFTSGTSLNQCQDTIPAACGSTAHCVLDGDQYLQGQFPGAQVFIVRTTGPQTVTFSFVFQNRVSPGTQLTLTSTEPDCSGVSSYTSQGDLFELAGASGVLSFPIEMMSAGDHLIQFSSDAYCSYELRY
jgi:hypothetical protein